MKELVIVLLPWVVMSALGWLAFGLAIWLFLKCLPQCVEEDWGIGDRSVYQLLLMILKSVFKQKKGKERRK